MNDDTIAAIATPLGEASIAIIRISGAHAISIADQVFIGKQKLAHSMSHKIHYGHIRDHEDGTLVEEVLISVMKGPRSFTAEDVVEINCHGGIVSVRKVLELVLQAGARLAEPGEFTKRAFLNGRIDLMQAEAVIDLIRSKSDRAFSNAMRQADGTLSKKIAEIRQQLIELMAHIEVNIDYPEHDVEMLTSQFIFDECTSALESLHHLLRTAKQGRILREGIVTAIVGRPNVGKSSLLNMLSQENKAIVTDIPGTTRDVIEETVTINGLPLKLLDTAGIRETSDIVEQIGVEKSKDALSQADLVLLLLNNNDELHEDDVTLMQQLVDKQTVVVINKTDLPQRLNVEAVRDYFKSEQLIPVSIKENEGIENLENVISNMFFEGQIEVDDPTYVSNVRHIQLLNDAVKCLEEALQAVEVSIPIDMIQIDIRRAWEHLGEMMGDAVSDTLLDQIFSQFCLGK